MNAKKESSESASQIKRAITGLYKQFWFGLELLSKKVSWPDLKVLANELLPEPQNYPYKGDLLRLDDSLLLILEREREAKNEVWVSHLPPQRRILRFSENFLKKECRDIKESQPQVDLTAVRRSLQSADGSFHLPLPGMVFVAKHNFTVRAETKAGKQSVSAFLHLGFSTKRQLSSVISTELYYPHLPNSFDGLGVCLGANDQAKKVTSGTLANTEHLLQLYFQSEFTNLHRKERYNPGMEKLELDNLLRWQKLSEFPMRKMAKQFSSENLLTTIKAVSRLEQEITNERLVTAIVRGLEKKPQQVIARLNLSEDSAKRLSNFGQACADHLARIREVITAEGFGYRKHLMPRWVMKRELEPELSSFSQIITEVV